MKVGDSRPSRLSLAVVTSIVTLLVAGARIAVAYTSNTTVSIPANYATFQPPARGGSYTDAIFGTAIKRISDAMNTIDAGRGGAVQSISQEYSSMSPFNMDNTRLLLQHFSYFAVYDGSGNFLKDLYQYGISASTEPRWSRTDPNEFYYISGNTLKRFNIGTNASTVVHAFTEYSRISGMGESDICFDGKHFVLAGNSRYVFVYDIAADAKGPVFDVGSSGLFDQLYITPDDNVIIGWYARGSNRQNGIELYDKNMNFQRQLAHAIGHMDVTRDTTGEEVALWANGADANLQVRCDAGITKIRLSDARQTCVWTGDWSLAAHVSASDNSGWFFVDTYNPKDVTPPTGWVPYTNELLQIKMDGTEVRRLAHHRSRPLNSYTYQPKASVSRDGSKLVYTSNYGLQKQMGYPTEYTDTYLIEIGTSTSEGDGGDSDATTTTTRIQEDASAVTYTSPWYVVTNDVYSGGSARGAISANYSATLNFTGTGVSVIMFTDAWSGIARIAVDGVSQGEVDAYSSSSRAQATVYTISNLTDGAHTITVSPTERMNANSGGTWIWLDAFDVISVAKPEAPPPPPPPPSPPPPSVVPYRAEQTDSAVQWTGEWMVNNNGVHSGGSAKLSMTAGSSATLTFTGTSVSWIAYRDQWSGIAGVTVDGVFVGEIDTYASPSKARASVYTVTGLTNGQHTITVFVMGRKNPSSGGSWIWVDAFDVNY
jgi:hypothetical protein